MNAHQRRVKRRAGEYARKKELIKRLTSEGKNAFEIAAAVEVLRSAISAERSLYVG